MKNDNVKEVKFGNSENLRTSSAWMSFAWYERVRNFGKYRKKSKLKGGKT
jgi:hypothetical protein